MENWTSLKALGFSKYEVSDMGNVRSIFNPEPLKSFDTNGYRKIKLSNDNGEVKNNYIHRLVLISFTQINTKKTVDHINRDKTDNRLVNLRWLTRSEQNTNKNPYTKNGCRVKQLNEDGTLVKIHHSKSAAAAEVGVRMINITRAVISGKKCKGFLWEEFNEFYEDEIWNIVPNIEYGILYASSYGRIKDSTGKIRSNVKDYHGQYTINVYNYKEAKYKNLSVHRLVISAFKGSSRAYVKHLDGNNLNNKIENLEYI